MKILHIDSNEDVNKINNLVEEGNHIFMLVYMVGCGPCNAVRPEWTKLGSTMKNQYPKHNNVVIIDINKDYLSEIKHIGQIDGFPTIKYITNKGTLVESYENSSITKKDRSLDSFIDWIESKILNGKVLSLTPIGSPLDVYKRISKNKQTNKKRKLTKTKRKTKQKGGKWTKKYKKSINCNKPKGFSQRQYCKYGRKK
jgi:hypothetical protein